MSPELVVSIGRQALQTAALLAAPLLGASLLAGLTVSIFQAVTQIHDMTLTFVPKIIIVSVVLIIFAPWMLNLIVDFTSNMLINLPNYIK